MFPPSALSRVTCGRTEWLPSVSPGWAQSGSRDEQLMGQGGVMTTTSSLKASVSKGMHQANHSSWAVRLVS